MIGTVILAAGAARRFGADKRLQPFGSSTVAVTTISKYCEVFDAVRLVVRSQDDPILALTQNLQVDVVVAEQAELGMGHSISAGFHNLNWRYAYVALADMPLIRTDTLRTLKASAAEQISRIIRPCNRQGDCGHPIGFPARFFTELEGCSGDQGARQLLTAHSDWVDVCSVEDDGLYTDIDTPTALAAAVSAAKAFAHPTD
ncbi:MAG: nucleotidyltransferase family protein [Pseudomonadales bacterium]|jgi:molybdenum cofactor cytidylyltransferase|nr:nucleotidyltransferase family protein [Pseudomonadales bacterium]